MNITEMSINNCKLRIEKLTKILDTNLVSFEREKQIRIDLSKLHYKLKISNVISRSKYLDALDIISLYHYQFERYYSIALASKRMTIDTFLSLYSNDLSIKMYTFLHSVSINKFTPEKGGIVYIDEITEKAVLSCRNVGQSTWVKLKLLIDTCHKEIHYGISE